MVYNGNIFLPLTPLQKQIVNYQSACPDDDAYNLNYVFEINGNISSRRLKVAVQEVFNQNAAFRLRITQSKGQCRQTLSDENISVQYIVDSSKDDALRKLRKTAALPFLLDGRPLARARIIETQTCTLLFIQVSHLIFDAFSLDSLLSQIRNVYLQRNRNGIDYSYIRYLQSRSSIQESKEAQFLLRSFYDDRNFSTDNLVSKDNCNEMRPNEFQDNSISYILIHSIAESYGVSTFTIIVAAFAFVIAQMANIDKVSVGVPFANRRRGVNGIGLYVNTLPLTIHVSPDELFSDYLFSIDCSLKVLSKRQEADVLGERGVISPNCAVTYYNHFQNLDIPGTTVKRIELHNSRSIFPIAIRCERNENDLLIHSSVVSTDANVPLAKYMSAVCESIYSHPTSSLREVSLMDARETKLLINRLKSSYDIHRYCSIKTLDNLVDSQCCSEPEHSAIRYREKSLDYAQVEALSNKLARFLDQSVSAQNVVVSEPVNLFLIPLVLAIFKAGKVYVPIDDAMPISRRATILQQLDNYVIIGDRHENRNWIGTISECCSKAGKYLSEAYKSKAHAEDTAYILFTSGSTGKPKGVPVSHRSIVSMFLSAVDVFNFTSGDVWTMFHSYSFDYSIWEMFAPLITGGTVVIVPPEIKMLPDAVRKILIENRVTIFCQTPSSFSNMQAYETTVSDYLLAKLKYIFIGGEYATSDVAQRWFDKYGTSGPNIVVLYGVTESAIMSTYKVLDLSEKTENGIIGRPFPNSCCYIRSNNGQLAPLGFMGELVICGLGVSAGYYAGNVVQQKSFIDVDSICECRGFQTHDIAYLNKDLDFIYVRRNDTQVKISGHRIELGEVKSAIDRCPGCQDSAVVVKDLGNTGNRLIGYFVRENDSNLSAEDLRRFLKDNLQSYMIPSFLLPITVLPLTTNGKLNEGMLPLPTVKHNYSSPKVNTTVVTILRVWEQVLGIEGIKPDDNFFDVGGTSLSLAKVYSLIIKVFSLNDNKIDMIDLFSYNTPLDLAEYIDKVK